MSGAGMHPFIDVERVDGEVVLQVYGFRCSCADPGEVIEASTTTISLLCKSRRAWMSAYRVARSLARIGCAYIDGSIDFHVVLSQAHILLVREDHQLRTVVIAPRVLTGAALARRGLRRG